MVIRVGWLFLVVAVRAWALVAAAAGACLADHAEIVSPPRATRRPSPLMRVRPVVCVLGDGMVIDPRVLDGEIREIKQRRLTANPGDNPVDWPLISSDAKYLAYSDKGGIRIKLLETGELQTIPPPTNFKPGRDAWTPAAWFPDSTRILVNGTQSGTSSIWIVSILRGAARLLRESSRAWRLAFDFHPSVAERN